MKSFFLRFPACSLLMVVCLVYGVAAWCRVALSWDGSGYLFTSLQAGEAVISHHRYSNLPTLGLIVQLSKTIQNPWTLGAIYSGAVALTPLISLTLSLWFLRHSTHHALRIWPVLGILAACLPGEICLMSEASLAVQAFWPVVAFILAGLPAAGSLLIAPILLYLYYLHPTTALMFFLAGVLTFTTILFQCKSMLQKGLWTLLFLGLGGLRFMDSLRTATPYERGEFGFKPNYDALMGSILGAPFFLLLCLYLFAWIYLAASTGFLNSQKARRLAFHCAWVFLVIGLIWAAVPAFWAGAIGYRRFVFMVSLPLIGFTFLHWLWIVLKIPDLETSPAFSGLTPLWVSALVGLIFMVQCFSWRSDVMRFQSDLEKFPGPFVVRAELPWISGHAVDHWSSSMLSVIVQSKSPKRIYVEKAEQIQGDRIELYPGGRLHLQDAWFNWETLKNMPSGGPIQQM